jgi:GT2 family glycosyltransferase
MLDLVSATRRSEKDFWNRSPLGLSLRRFAPDGRLVAHVAFANQRGLPDIYNSRIAAAGGDDLLVFVHDDVWIDDYFLVDRVIEALRTYDVIGVAGNRRRVPGQPAWIFADMTWTYDRANLSGAVAHGDHPFGPVSWYGPAPADCELLDGVLIAARAAALKEKEVLFDPRFDFHFYDMDFCRTARERGLRLGTWPICVTHRSSGSFGKGPWTQRLRTYKEKWGD